MFWILLYIHYFYIIIKYLLRYEGEFHEGMRHGKGIHYHLCGSKYEG